MKSLEELLEASRSLHNHTCPGQVIGVRMAMLGCGLVGVEEPAQSKELLVYVEIDRCVTDAIQAVTGCKLGKRTLKYMDYGKVAATFYNITTGEAVRVVARDDSRQLAWAYAPVGLDKKAAQVYAYKIIPDDEIFKIMPVSLEVPETDLPGPPRRCVTCEVCEEGVSDGREVTQGERTLCRACAEGAYYRSVQSALTR